MDIRSSSSCLLNIKVYLIQFVIHKKVEVARMPELVMEVLSITVGRKKKEEVFVWLWLVAGDILRFFLNGTLFQKLESLPHLG